jgi:hypothetical protein
MALCSAANGSKTPDWTKGLKVIKDVFATKEKSERFGREDKGTLQSGMDIAHVLELGGEFKAALQEYDKLETRIRDAPQLGEKSKMFKDLIEFKKRIKR